MVFSKCMYECVYMGMYLCIVIVGEIWTLSL